jgi:hypothetical protein
LNYNWRNTLGDYASICGVLAGFCVALIGVVFAGSLASKTLFSNLSYGQLSVLFLGITAVLFISSAELLLQGKARDIFGCPNEYFEWLRTIYDENQIAKIKTAANDELTENYQLAKKFYNSAIILLYFGLLFLIAPYNLIIAAIVFLVGFGFEVWQLTKDMHLRSNGNKPKE